MFKLASKPKAVSFEPLKAGSYNGILKSGYVRKTYDSKYQKDKTAISLAFELPSEIYSKDGESHHRQVFLYETLSSGDRSNLYKKFLSNLPSSDIGITFETIQNPYEDISEYDTKYPLTDFLCNGKSLLGKEFEILLGKPANPASSFNEVHSIGLLEDLPF